MTQAYANGKIYKIVNKNDPEEFYIGSTKNHLYVRWQGHKIKSKQKPDRLLYQRMNELGFDCYHMVLIEDYPCDSKSQLLQREDFWICELKPKLNKCRAYLTDDEKKEQRNRCCNKYYAENKEKCLEKKREYYSNNKEKCLEKKREYRKNNKEQINEKQKQKVQCEICHSVVRKSDIARHKRTKKCQSYQQKEPEYTEIEFLD